MTTFDTTLSGAAPAVPVPTGPAVAPATTDATGRLVLPASSSLADRIRSGADALGAGQYRLCLDIHRRHTGE